MNSGIVKSLAAVLFLNALAAGAWFFFYKEIASERDGVLSLKNDILVADAKLKNIRSLGQSLESIAEDREKAEKIFVSSEEIVEFIEDTEELARLSGVEMEIKSAALPAKLEDKGPIFSVKLDGAFGQVFRFSSLLEKTNYEISFEEVKLAKGEDGRWIGEIELKLLSYKF